MTPSTSRTVWVRGDQYLLDAASSAGLELPFTCLQGWCVSCAAVVESGEVDQSEAFRLYEEDTRARFVLLCSAYPRSDACIRTHQREVMRTHRRRHGLPAPGA